MTRRLEALALLLALAPATAGAVVFSGVVEVQGAQPIIVPPSLSSPVVLRYYAPDGSRLHKGDAVLRIDAGDAESEVQTAQAQIAQAQAKDAKVVTGLQIKQIDAALALADAQAARDDAAVDAAIPRGLIPAISYDRYQGELKRSTQALALKQAELAQATAAVARQRKDDALALRKLQDTLAFNQQQVARAVVHADQDGTLVHGFDNVFGSGERYDEGSTSFPGAKVGELVGSGRGYDVRAWVLAPDATGLRVGEPLRLHFDALPGSAATGHIRSIAAAPASHSAWGKGRYVELAVALPASLPQPLLQGMSVRLDSDLGDPGVRAAAVRAAAAKALSLDGEVYAQRSVAISPPPVRGIWQLTVTQIAGDGERVHKGTPVVIFDGTQVQKSLIAKQGELDEKRRQQEQLRLDLADRARAAELSAAQAKAAMDKAERKAAQPREYIARVDYDKLVIARRLAEQRYALMQQRSGVDAAERAAEQHESAAGVAQLRDEVARLKAELASLTVLAPRDGIVLHHSSFGGGKIDVGSQVWMGQSVAQMPDLATLAVRAALPEHELTRVAVGQRVRVTLSGGGERSLDGRITAIGDTVHSRSKVDPVPVVDLVVTLGKALAGLKPGEPVQVALPAQAVAR